MSRFSHALKQDLYAAQMKFSSESKYDLSAVMGNLAGVAAAMGKLIKSDMLTPVEELQYFRGQLNSHLDWQNEAYNCDSEDAAMARKIVNDLTETSHLL